jgi:hypothetical protein
MRPGILVFALACGTASFPAMAAAAAALDSVSVRPSWVEAHRAFTLVVEGESPSCALQFSHPEARLTGGKLVLSALAQARIGVLCVNVPSFHYRVEFAAPALDTGAYPVQVRWAQACEFDPAPCPAAYMPRDVGNLRVTDSAHLEYHIPPAAVPAGQGFRLPLRGGLGCGDRVGSLSVDTARPALTLDFSITWLDGKCDTTVAPLQFPVPALQAGVWQVYVRRMSPCPEGRMCTMSLPPPSLAGALDVKEGAAVLAAPAPKRSGPALPPGAAFRIDWQGSARDAAGRRQPRFPNQTQSAASDPH